MAWKVNMHRGYLAICNPEEQQLNFIERLVEMASSLAIREWRRLPHIVSHVHTPLLQVRGHPEVRPQHEAALTISVFFLYGNKESSWRETASCFPPALLWVGVTTGVHGV